MQNEVRGSGCSLVPELRGPGGCEPGRQRQPWGREAEQSPREPPGQRSGRRGAGLSRQPGPQEPSKGCTVKGAQHLGCPALRGGPEKSSQEATQDPHTAEASENTQDPQAGPLKGDIWGNGKWK